MTIGSEMVTYRVSLRVTYRQTPSGLLSRIPAKLSSHLPSIPFQFPIHLAVSCWHDG